MELKRKIFSSLENPTGVESAIREFLYEDIPGSSGWHPVTRSYFSLFVRMIALASGEKPEIAFDDLLAARDKPLFESLKDLPKTSVKLPSAIEATTTGSRAHASLKITSGGDYARLVRVRAEWPATKAAAPYLVKYSDNYIDLLPGEEKSLDLEIFLPSIHGGRIVGTLIVEGPNIEAQRIPIGVPNP
jgi:hypothetical protein